MGRLPDDEERNQAFRHVDVSVPAPGAVSVPAPGAVSAPTPGAFSVPPPGAESVPGPTTRPSVDGSDAVSHARNRENLARRKEAREARASARRTNSRMPQESSGSLPELGTNEDSERSIGNEGSNSSIANESSGKIKDTKHEDNIPSRNVTQQVQRLNSRANARAQRIAARQSLCTGPGAPDQNKARSEGSSNEKSLASDVSPQRKRSITPPRRPVGGYASMRASRRSQRIAERSMRGDFKSTEDVLDNSGGFEDRSNSILEEEEEAPISSQNASIHSPATSPGVVRVTGPSNDRAQQKAARSAIVVPSVGDSIMEGESNHGDTIAEESASHDDIPATSPGIVRVTGPSNDRAQRKAAHSSVLPTSGSSILERESNHSGTIAEESTPRDVLATSPGVVRVTGPGNGRAQRKATRSAIVSLSVDSIIGQDSSHHEFEEEFTNDDKSLQCPFSAVTTPGANRVSGSAIDRAQQKTDEGSSTNRSSTAEESVNDKEKSHDESFEVVSTPGAMRASARHGSGRDHVQRKIARSAIRSEGDNALLANADESTMNDNSMMEDDECSLNDIGRPMDPNRARNGSSVRPFYSSDSVSGAGTVPSRDDLVQRKVAREARRAMRGSRMQSSEEDLTEHSLIEDPIVERNEERNFDDKLADHAPPLRQNAEGLAEAHMSANGGSNIIDRGYGAFYAEDGREKDDNLAVAIAVAEDEEEEDKFLAAAYEYDPSTKPPFYKNRRFRLYGLLGCCVVIVAVIASIVAILNRSDSEPAVIFLTESPSPAPSFPPTSTRDTQFRTLFASTIEREIEPGSPEDTAAKWILSEDPMKLEFNADNLVQRYLLVLLYFQTTENGQGRWRTCGPPEEDETDDCIYLEPVREDGDLTIFYRPPKEGGERTRWLTGTSECDWAQIVCDENDDVISIQLRGMNMTGPLPIHLIHFKMLIILSFQGNNFTSALPEEYVKFRHLNSLELTVNKLTGSIPEIYYEKLTNLWVLNLGENFLTGTISTQIAKMRGLRSIFLYSNQITGELPSEIGILDSSFLRLRVDDCEMTGSIPTEFGLLTNLREFNVGNNELTGSIPNGFGQMTKLERLEIDANMLTGPIPEDFFEPGPAGFLRYFNVQLNMLTGTISPDFATLRNLDRFQISDNLFSGSIPDGIGTRMSLLRTAWFNFNDQLTGSIPEDFCGSSNRLENLQADCLPRGNPPNPCICCNVCCDRDARICFVE